MNQQLQNNETQIPAQAPMKYESGAVIPRDADEAYTVACQLANSGMVPRAYQGRPDMILVAIQMGSELGFSPIMALSSIAVVNGTPCMWGDGLLAKVLDDELMEDIDETFEGEYGKDDFTAICTVSRKGMKKEKVRSFSIADAKLAGLWSKSGPWKQYPKRMLQLRARAFALRDVFPDVLKGLKVREEVEDYSGTPLDNQRTVAQAKSVFQKPVEGEVVE